MSAHPQELRAVVLPDGRRLPALGMGTWTMGEHVGRAAREIAALRRGADLGMTLVDTAEMYADGGAERIVAQAFAGRRDDVFVVSKVYPHHADARGVPAACERSLRRLATDRIDLYLLHWRGEVPLAETVDAFERLRTQGKILRWGVSNFDVSDMDELLALPEGRHCAFNQVLYNLSERGIEWRLLQTCREHAITVMAYSPFGQGPLLAHPALRSLARALGATPARVALAWLLAQEGVIAIPQSSNVEHVDDNRAAAQWALDTPTIELLDAAFPPPHRAHPLAML
jgi:diketogulonate reductase-like aldo/keto reductase